MLPFGETLFLWRMDRGLTQEELGRIAGISRPNLSAMEGGSREVTLKTLRALAVALNVQPGLLVDGIPPHSEEVPRSFSRQALERVADGIVHGTALRNSGERRFAQLAAPVVQSKALALGIRIKAKPVQSKRAREAGWLLLNSQYSPQTVRSLIQRIADRQKLL